MRERLVEYESHRHCETNPIVTHLHYTPLFSSSINRRQNHNKIQLKKTTIRFCNPPYKLAHSETSKPTKKKNTITVQNVNVRKHAPRECREILRGDLRVKRICSNSFWAYKASLILRLVDSAVRELTAEQRERVFRTRNQTKRAEAMASVQESMVGWWGRSTGI